MAHFDRPIQFRVALINTGIGAAVIAVTALIYAFSKAGESLKVLNQVQKEATKQTAKQKSSLEQLIKVAKNDKISKEDRLKAIKKINSISPEYLGNITLETINTDEATSAINKYIKALDKKALAQALQNKRESLVSELVEKDLKNIDEYKLAIEKFGDNSP